MRKVIASALLLLVAGGGWFATRAPTVESQPGVSQGDETAPLEAEQGDAASAVRMPPTRTAASTRTAPSDFESLDAKSLRGEQRRELFLVAQTPEEAHWLESRGYPRPSEWAARNEIALEVLEARIAAGDTRAMVILADRLSTMAKPGTKFWASPERARAAELLQQAFEEGNVFAQAVQVDLMLKYYEQTPPIGADGRPYRRGWSQVLQPVQMLAVLGDYRAGDLALSRRIPPMERPSEAEMSSMISVSLGLLAQVNARRAARGLPPIVPAPRPGADSALAANIDGKPFMQWRGWR